MAARYRWDNVLLDLDAYRLERDGVPLALEPKAFNLLVLMVQRPGHLFRKQEIFEAIWPDTVVTDHALTRVVAQLRRVLGDEAREARYIETVPTRGYRWIRPVEEDMVSAAVSSSLPVTSFPHPATPASPAAAPGVDSSRGVPSRPTSSFVRWTATFALASVVLTLLVWVQRGTPTSATGIPTVPGNNTVPGPATNLPAGDVRWPVQLTTHAGLDLQPALSPQGDALAFVSDRTGALEIFVRGFGGAAAETALTTDGGHNVQPAWSPDGRWLAFHSYRRGGIWVMPARGGVQRQVAAVGSNPAWSPDGRRIAFQSDEHADVTPSAFGAQNGSTIWSVSAEGGDLRELTRSGHPMGGHAAPAWSRDGRYLAFTVFEAGPNNGVWLLTVATGETKPLMRGHGLYELVFAPDDSALYAAGGEAMIVRLPFDASAAVIRGAREVIPIPGVPGVRGLSLSPDGRRMAFAGVGLSSQIWVQPIGADGSRRGPANALTSDTSQRNSLPVVSRDGAKVAYMSRRGGEAPKVWVMDSDGRNGSQITSDESADAHPTWFPDGQRVAFMSNRHAIKGFWAVDVATRREELLFDATRVLRAASKEGRIIGSVSELQLSPSLTSAAFSVRVPPTGRRTMYVARLEPFEPRALTDSTVSAGYPAWSPDERQVAVEIKDGSSTHAGVVDVATGMLRRLTNERGQTWVRSWSPDGRKIAVAAFRDGVWSLRWIDSVNGEQGTIAAAEPPDVYLRYPEWSPRGDVVVFERGELRGNVWSLTLR